MAKNKKKNKTKIPPKIAAQILFVSDRMCCVCRKEGKYVEIHHIDEKPANSNDIENLAVLCKDCHTDTQISGGFHRKLDAHQVRLYRQDWLSSVAKKRAAQSLEEQNKIIKEYPELDITKNIIEFYKKIGNYKLLAIHYDVTKNIELRDRYIEELLKKEATDENIIYYRSIQNKIDLIPKQVIKREIKRLSRKRSWHLLARLYSNIGNHKAAAEYYIKDIAGSLKKGSLFSAAFYIKELNEKTLEELFKIQLQKVSKKRDLWWQIRCLQELGRESDVRALVLKNKTKIRKSNDIQLKILLAIIEGDDEEYLRLRIEEAEKYEI